MRLFPTPDESFTIRVDILDQEEYQLAIARIKDILDGYTGGDIHVEHRQVSKDINVVKQVLVDLDDSGWRLLLFDHWFCIKGSTHKIPRQVVVVAKKGGIWQWLLRLFQI